MISEFYGPHSWLSNFYPSEIRYNDLVFPTIEHAFQAAKTLDPISQRLIQKALRPKEAKRLGRMVKLRSDWEETKLAVMAALVNLKFKDPVLRELLLETGDQELVEGNHWNDTFWGVCNGVGQNHLGKIIMNERAKIRTETTSSQVKEVYSRAADRDVETLSTTLLYLGSVDREAAVAHISKLLVNLAPVDERVQEALAALRKKG